MTNKTFSILITTKNRKVDLAFTLDKIKYSLQMKIIFHPNRLKLSVFHQL